MFVIFRYTLILTYNLWRNYPLSAFFEYIFLFVQGRCWRFSLFWRLFICRRFTSSMGIIEIFYTWKRQTNWSINSNLWNMHVNKSHVSLCLLICKTSLNRFTLYVIASLFDYLPHAWMSVCTVRDCFSIQFNRILIV